MEGDQYVNSPAGDRSDGEQQRGNSPPGRSKILLFVGLSFGLLCIIQTAINVSVQLQAVECSNSSDHDPTSNITRMSDSDIRDLILERDQLLRDKDQLKQEKDQLLHRGDHLLQDNKQLKREKDRLKQQKDRLLQEKDQLLQERDHLIQDNKQLTQQKDRLLQEKDQLNQDNKQLKREKDRLKQQKDQLLREKDQLNQDNNQLKQQKDRLLQEKDQLLQERDHLLQDNKQLKQQKDRLLQEKDQLLQERDHLLQDNKQLKQQKDRLLQEKDQLLREKDQLIEDKRILNEKIRSLQMGVQTSPRCPPGWRSYKSACYLLSPETNTWDYAKYDCETKGAHLVVFNNRAEEAVVSAFGCSLEMWMGLRTQQHLMSCEWILEDGSQLRYTNWNNQPCCYNFSPYEYCAYADKGSSSWNSWFLGSCDDRRFWMCEMQQRNICH